MSVSRFLPFVRGILLGAAIAMVSSAASAQKREFSFAYDQPKNSGYGIGAEIFNKKLTELSKAEVNQPIHKPCCCLNNISSKERPDV